jgi:dephospho-CoA kinase
MPLRIALTGGIASGKSTVAGMFARLGAVILDADSIAREVVKPGTPCWQKLRELFGTDYFDTNGELDRRRLRELIIRDPHFRTRLNAILHPAIMDRMEADWQESGKTHPDRPVLFDIPLLFEAHMAERFDKVILVYASPESQVLRLMARDGVTRPEAERTLSMQLPIDSKKERADIIVDNSLDEENTQRQVAMVWEEIQRGWADSGPWMGSTSRQ